MKTRFAYGETITPDQMKPGHLYLDGACQGPAVRMDLPAISFDHHAGCVRTFTLATCQQVYTAIWLGFKPDLFETVVINDIDADTMVSLWLLEHADTVVKDPRVIDLVEGIGLVDAHGPVLPYHPIHEHLTLPRGHRQTVDDIDRLLDAIQTWYDDGSLPPPKSGVEMGPSWIGIARDGRLVSGFGDFQKAYLQASVVLLCPRGLNDTIAYTIGKRSEFVPYDIPAFLARMNLIEPGWGGGSTIGGAPRHPDGSRSKLSPALVTQVLHEMAPRKGST